MFWRENLCPDLISNFSHLGMSDFSQISRTIQVLTSQIQEFVYDYNTSSSSSSSSSTTKSKQTKENVVGGDWNFPGLKVSSSSSLHNVNKPNNNNNNNNIDNNGKESLTEIVLLQQRVVLQMIDRLKLCAHRCQYTPNQPLTEMSRILTTLEKSFAKYVDMLLLKEIKILIDELESPTSEIGLRSCLNTVIQLGNEGSKHACRLVSQQGGIRALLNLTYNYSSVISGSGNRTVSDIRILALRGLSSICCEVECIRELERCNGIAMINDLLCSRQSSMEDRIETAGVLAQITSPWIDNNVSINGLDDYVPDLIASLTSTFFIYLFFFIFVLLHLAI